MISVKEAIAALSRKERAQLVSRSPLSFAQQRLWFLERLEPGRSTFNMSAAYEVEGNFSVATFRESLNDVVRRHDTLRTSFMEFDGETIQVVQSDVKASMPLVDLRGLAPEQLDRTIEYLRQTAGRQPFDLTDAPLLRCSLVRRGEKQHVLFITVHHIVFDGWSFSILFRELFSALSCRTAGRPVAFRDLPLQYTAFARWQRHQMTGKVLEQHLTYWKRQLAGLAPVLVIPTDQPRTSTASLEGGLEAVEFKPATVRALRFLAQRAGVTVYVAALAMFQGLVARLTGVSDVAIGTPVASRDQEELKDVIGLLLNTVVIRTNLSGDPSALELMRRVHETTAGALAHQDLPFEKLVEALQPERSRSHAPIVQMAFVFLNNPPAAVEHMGLQITPLPNTGRTTELDLNVALMPFGDGYRIHCDYNRSLYDGSTIVRLLRQFEQLIEGMAADPAASLSRIPLGTKSGREIAFRPASPAQTATPLLECIERSALETPAKCALVFDDQHITYAGLNARANRLARYLRRIGVGPDVPVGIVMDRSTDLLVALLAVLKAGGAYVPLDPAYPAERFAYMLEDSHIPVLLIHSRHENSLPLHDATVVRLDTEWDAISAYGDTAVSFAVEPLNLAYIIYTSGSTGRPKGVDVTHAAVANFVESMRNIPGIASQDRVLAHTTISFDIAVLELWATLSNGGTAVMVGRETAVDGRRLAEVIDREAVNVVQATPATWRILLEAGWSTRGSVKALAGGEALSPDLANAICSAGGDVWNMYGPTETTVWSSVSHVDQGSPVSIGTPISATSISVMVESLQEAAEAEVGELYIGGVGLARGYHNRPDLTAERFLPDPSSASPGARMYRTGDKGRYKSDGTLECLGRVDDQVKLRGYRIEPGEIEASLRQHRSIAEAAVVLRPLAAGEPGLVAYIVAHSGETPDTVQLRSWLQKRLPAYMVPSRIVLRAALPRTAGGKIDRQALPAPPPEALEAGEVTLPRSPLEEEVAKIWSEVLDLKGPADVNTTFFDVGGHSLLALRLVDRIRAKWPIEFPLSSVFDAPTIAAIASRIATAKASDSAAFGNASLTIEPDLASRYEPFQLSDVQQAYWIGRNASFELGNVATHIYTELEVPALDLERMTEAVNRLIGRHDMLRAIVQPDGLQRVLKETPPYQIRCMDLSAFSLEETQTALTETRATMSHQLMATDKWPLFDIRASLLSGGRTRLHFSMDLLIADVWSLSILLTELSRFYQNPASELPPLHLTFRDFVLAELAQRRSDTYHRAEQYWRQRLKELPAGPDLPLATDPASIRQPRFSRRTGSLPPEKWSALKTQTAATGLSPSGVLLAAFAEVLAAWSCTPRFTLTLTLFNRLPIHAEIHSVVGDFTSLIVVDADTSQPGTFAWRARLLQERLWRDLEHRSFSPLQVLREAAMQQGRSGMPLFPVVFTSTLGQPSDAVDLFSGGQSGGSGTRHIYGISQTSQVWLDHQIGEYDGALVFNWDAVEGLFLPGVLDAMWESYGAMLDSLCSASWETARPAVPAEQLQLRAAINATKAPVTGDLLHTIFRKQVDVRPLQVAVEAADRKLTYLELHQESEAIGKRLRSCGARGGELVAVVMEKGWEQVAAVFGILKAGSAYLPIDATLPSDRVRQLLEIGEVRFVLTQPDLEARLEWPQEIMRFTVAAGDADCEKPELDPCQEPDDLAYVIFTSGSTGVPKGVMISHRGALNTILDINRRFDVGPGDKVLALSALGFDLSVYDIFGMLAAGGTIVIPRVTATPDPSYWRKLVRDEGVTIWNSVPALMELAAGEINTFGGDNLRLAMLSGDWIPVSLPDKIRDVYPACRIFSLGGATEASIWSIAYAIDEVDPAWVSIPYGKPLDNQRFYVLNDSLEDCPVWVTGNLYIGGIGLAMGYWRDAQKTNASFIVHPRTSERLYRTGDLGRYLPDGNIEFLGRQDLQVKIHGHRIELGEIESVLEQQSGVKQAVVVALGPARHRDRLAAYVVPAEDNGFDAGVLTAFLRERLPAYMVPTSILALPAVPLSANGKVDRQALMARAEREFKENRKPVQDRSSTIVEQRIIAIWGELLGQSNINVHDNFFELGGNSLLAIRMVQRLKDTCGAALDLRALFQTPTVEGVAAAIGQAMEQGSEASLETFRIVPDAAHRFEPFPLNDVQHAYWVGRTTAFELGNVAAHGYNEFDTAGLDVARLTHAVRCLVDRHEMLRAIVRSDGLQQILRDVPSYTIHVADLTTLDPDTIQKRLNETREELSHAVRPTDQWPLFEIRVSQLPEGRQRLHVSLDILLADAWSSRLMSRDLALFYHDPVRVMPPREVSFRDYVLAEQSLRTSALYEQSRRYWMDRIPNLPPAPDLPLIKSTGAIEKPRFVRRANRLPEERWARIKSRAAALGITPSACLLTAFCEVLALWSRSSRFTLSLTLFNRLPLHDEVDEIVGDFTSVTLVAFDAGSVESFEARAIGVQGQLWDHLQHRYINGIEVVRQWAKALGRGQAALTPAVFTSMLFETRSGGVQERVPELRMESVCAVSQTPQVWLDHQAQEQNGDLLFSWDIVEELFPKGLFEEIFACYTGLLEQLAEVPSTWTDARRSLLPNRQRAARQSYNDTGVPVPDGLLHNGFEEQARRHPGRTAVIASGRHLTYGELDLRAEALAARLRDLDAKPNELVAVVMEKGWEQIVAVLAILKSGAAYLPIDASWPTDRLWRCLEAGRVRVVVTQPWIDQTKLPAGLVPITVDSVGQPARSDLTEAATAAARTRPSVEDLAYVIFTSGSTGMPKGVMIDHCGAVNTIADINSRFGVTENDRVLALSSLTFDLSVYDVFGVLAAGGAIVMPPAQASRDAGQWVDLIEEHGVTLWNSVPALMEMLVDGLGAKPAACLDSVRLVMLSGDWIPTALPDRIRSAFERARIISLGGATEASIWSIFHPVENVDAAEASIPYGRPLSNQTMHVLNDILDPSPEWVPGQLYIGGIGLAKGYWGDEDKTRKSFFIHPATGERLYGTGDWGRFKPDGNIEFLGREDLQVKIRGHRIELGEIEAVIAQCPIVHSGVVAAVGENRERRQLALYVVFKDDDDQPEEASTLAAVEAPSTAPTEDAIAELLECLRQIPIEGFPLPKYRYPSAGNLYPIQAYVLLGGNLHYYHPAKHALVPLKALSSPVSRDAAPLIFFVARMGAIQPMYGELSPMFCLLEAGYMTESMLDNARECVVDVSPLERAVLQGFERLFAFEPDLVLLQGFAVGATENVQRLAPSAAVHDSAYVRMRQLAGKPNGAGNSTMLASEVDRLAFKLSEPGLRPVHTGQEVIPFGQRAIDGRSIRLWTYRQSDRQFGSQAVSNAAMSSVLRTFNRSDDSPGTNAIDVYLFAKPERIEGLEGGLYRYDAEFGLLTRIAPDVVIGPLYSGVNTPAYDASAFSLFLVTDGTPAAAKAEVTDRTLLYAGSLGQRLLMNAPELGVGLCPVGAISAPAGGVLTDLLQNKTVVHSFLGGAIEPRMRSGNSKEKVFDQAQSENRKIRLLEFLRTKLPEYMIPTSVIVLRELPLTSNGKVDRKALPLPSAVHWAAGDSFEAPATPLEQRIASLWEEILHCGRVGAQDDFFTLGGDSVLAIRFLARLRDDGFEVRVADFFGSPRVRRIASLAEPVAKVSNDEFAGAAISQEELDDLIARYGDTHEHNETTF